MSTRDDAGRLELLQGTLDLLILMARFYTLTRASRKQLITETSKWQRLVTAIGRILGPAAEEG